MSLYCYFSVIKHASCFQFFNHFLYYHFDCVFFFQYVPFMVWLDREGHFSGTLSLADTARVPKTDFDFGKNLFLGERLCRPMTRHSCLGPPTLDPVGTSALSEWCWRMRRIQPPYSVRTFVTSSTMLLTCF